MECSTCWLLQRSPFPLKAPSLLHWAAGCLQEMEMSPTTNLALLRVVVFLFLAVVGMAGAAEDECCKEKKVGSVVYTLLPPDHADRKLPHQCLNNCVYTLAGTLSPKFCFQKGSSNVTPLEELGFPYRTILSYFKVIFLLSAYRTNQVRKRSNIFFGFNLLSLIW